MRRGRTEQSTCKWRSSTQWQRAVAAGRECTRRRRSARRGRNLSLFECSGHLRFDLIQRKVFDFVDEILVVELDDVAEFSG
jgi:hypothetical protein